MPLSSRTPSRSTKFNPVKASLALLASLAIQCPQSTAVVTSDAYGTHIATPGETMYGIDHDGVAQILSNGSFSCSGALLEGGMHVLTAGHCVANPNLATITIRFTLPSGVVDIEAHSWQAHPDYPQESGTDVGIITLSERAPPEIPRYSPLRTVGMDIDKPNYLFGYGVTGYGGTGKDRRDGNKRGGRNRYEATANSPSIRTATLGGDDSERWIFSDFDSGLAENDAFGFHFGKTDLGYNDDESYASSGDSGGPIFVRNAYSHVIAGVVSGGTRYPADPNADLDDLVNATWGQFSRDTRISAATNLAFVESFISTVLEVQPLQIVSSPQGLKAQINADGGQTIYLRSSSNLVVWEQLQVHRTSLPEESILILPNAELASLDALFISAVREPTTPPELPEIPPDEPDPELQPIPSTGLVGSDGTADIILSISKETANTSSLGSSNTFQLNGLAFDVNTNTLYGVDTALDALFAIDAPTGQIERRGNLEVDFPSVAGLAFDPATDTLYASSNGAAANLYTVNTATGAATAIGPIGLNLPGLAFDPSSSTLYGVSGQTDSLYTINATTAAPTLIGSLGINTSYCGLAYDASSDTLYLSDPVSDSLYSVDRNRGTATLIGSLDSPQVNGLAARNAP